MFKNLKPLIAVFFLTATLATSAQNVGINTTGAAPAASAMLEITATDRGVLIPRVALTATNVASPITAPDVSLLVYNSATTGVAPNNVTPGYYYWNGAQWVRFDTGNNIGDWKILGNSGTNPATNFIGTTDNQSFVVRTNNLERMRVLNNGQVVVNNATPFAGDVLSAFSGGADYAMSGYATGSGAGVYGENSSTGNAMMAINVGATSFALRAANQNANGTGMLVTGNNAAGGYLVAGSAGAFTANRIGVYSVSLNTSGAVTSTGVMGRDANGGIILLTGGAGVTGVAGNTGVGVFAHNSGTGTALYALNSNATSNTASFINQNASGTAIIASGNNTTQNYLVAGSGIAANGTAIGVYGRGNNNANGTAGGYFENGSGHFAYVAARGGGGVGGTAATNYKIIGNGTVSTIVNDLDGKKVTLFCPEAPEVLFQDFGKGQLINGKASIKLDPIFTKNIVVNEKHPLRVFIQLEGNCQGVYVTNQSSTGFDVIELNNGSSNAPFSFFVSANRADDVNENGVTVSEFTNIRFPFAPGMMESTSLENKTISNEESIDSDRLIFRDSNEK